jgi:hypothetical protein
MSHYMPRAQSCLRPQLVNLGEQTCCSAVSSTSPLLSHGAQQPGSHSNWVITHSHVRYNIVIIIIIIIIIIIEIKRPNIIQGLRRVVELMVIIRDKH